MITTNLTNFKKDINKLKEEILKAFDIGGLAQNLTNDSKKSAVESFKYPSGRLSNSIEMEGSALKYTIGTDSDYAKIQNEGGEIHPVKAKYLAIPLKRYLSSPKNYSNLIVIKKKQLTLMDKNTGEFLFVLKKSIKIKATKWWDKAINLLLSKHIPKMKSNLERIIKNA